jgi:hypothetical protein
MRQKKSLGATTLFHKGKLLERRIDITPAEHGESTETEVA